MKALLLLFLITSVSQITFGSDSDILGGPTKKLYKLVIKEDIDLIPSTFKGVIFVSAFRNGHTVLEEEFNTLQEDSERTEKVCWFNVYMDDKTFTEYIDNKKSPKLILKRQEIELGWDSIQFSNTYSSTTNVKKLYTNFIHFYFPSNSPQGRFNII